MVGARPQGRLRAAQRIKTRPEFQLIQLRGRRVITPHFVFLIQAREQGGPPLALARLGITASRKIGGSVVRNRAKRLVREAFRSSRELWPNGVDTVVIVRKPLSKLRLDDVVKEWFAARAEFERVFRKLLPHKAPTRASQGSA